MSFLKCKDCIVRSCCGEVCEDFKEYARKTFNITIGNKITLKQVEIAFGNIKEVDNNILNWKLSKVDNNKILMMHKQKGENNDTE